MTKPKPTKGWVEYSELSGAPHIYWNGMNWVFEVSHRKTFGSRAVLITPILPKKRKAKK